MTRSPYKLLDYYRFEDADLFFGREEETRKMVGEILSSRLLVLFSPSGSGKTSLINAGVRPQLEEMGYKTIYTRMENDPIPSVCHAVSEALNIPECKEKEGLYEFLKKAVQAAEQPLVIFLDQFEEFFIVYRDKKELRQQLIEQVAQITYDDELPLLLVFSIREDYFANLHEFRKVIPSIFQNNANIRLEPFSEEAAHQAIERPLKTVGFNYEKGLVDTLLKDLNKNAAGIEPITLQLVCSTLWNQIPDGSNQVTIASYKDCGGAENILNNFIYERLKKIPRKNHKLVIKIFDSLRTSDNTKLFLSFEDLQSQLNIKNPKRLGVLLQKLSNLDVFRREKRRGTDWYEFKHDYIVSEINGWIKKCREQINRKRMLYAVLPGIVLFFVISCYFFIQYNTFYAYFINKEYQEQSEEVGIYRGIPLGEYITTGYLLEPHVKDVDATNTLRNKLNISFWDKYNWKKLADKLSIPESGKFLYFIGETELGVERLIQTFKNYDRKECRQAFEILVQLGKVDNSVLGAIVQALKDENVDVKRQAAYILGRLGKTNRTAIDTLFSALEDRDPDVRKKASDTLVRLGNSDNTVIETLINILDDKNVDVRRQVAYILGKLGKTNKTAIDTLFSALKDKDPDVRKKASDTLVRLGNSDNTVIETLINILDDKNVDVRRQAAYTLVRLGKANKTIINELILALKDEYPHVREKAADALGSLGKADKKVIEALLQALKDKYPYVRTQVTNTLGSLGKADKIVIETLIMTLKDKDPSVQGHVAASLVRLGKADETVIEVLIEALKDGDYDVRLQAAASLGIHWQKKPETELIELLKHPLSGYRTGAAYALAKKGSISQKTLDEINRLKDTDPRPWVRLGAWKAFEVIQEKKEKEEKKDQ